MIGRLDIGIFAYLVALMLVGWINYWWFVAFVLLSPLISAVMAFRDDEFWPAVHPQYGFFWTMPTIFLLYGMALRHPEEWGQWLLWSAFISIVIVVIWTVALRQWIDREWAVFGTLGLVFVFVAFGLHVANGALPGQKRTSEVATITLSHAPGYRSPAWMELSTRTRERVLFFPGLRRYFDFEPTDAACLLTYSGGLGWSWETIAPCTDEDIADWIAD